MQLSPFALEVAAVAGAFAAAGIISFLCTPLAKRVAKKVGAIDIPKDNRRMHKTPIPRLGGMAIFLGFLICVLFFMEFPPTRFFFSTISLSMRRVLMGAGVIFAVGVVDDAMDVKWPIKLALQFVAAGIAVSGGLKISLLTNFALGGHGYLNLGWLSVPVTILWIVAVTNAVNFIDGLDGLAAGISSIASFSLLVISILVSDPGIAVIAAALAGSCMGFLPYNLNPAKIFMGDSGATFLGYMLATLSVMGLFKFYAVVSFVVPFLVLGLPLFDTIFAILRRLLQGKSPMHADRGHLHHRLVDAGFSTKQSVAIMYAISVLLGVIAVLLTTSGPFRAVLAAATFLLVLVVASRAFNHSDKLKSILGERRRK